MTPGCVRPKLILLVAGVDQCRFSSLEMAEQLRPQQLLFGEHRYGAQQQVEIVPNYERPLASDGFQQRNVHLPHRSDKAMTRPATRSNSDSVFITSARCLAISLFGSSPHRWRWHPIHRERQWRRDNPQGWNFSALVERMLALQVPNPS